MKEDPKHSPHHLTRRNFLGRAAITGSFLSLGGLQVFGADPGQKAPKGAPAPSSELGELAEPARQVPVFDEVDVCVCGGGPAGVMAAIAAARQGASVRCIEAHGCLGGIWTSGCLCWLQGHRYKGGLSQDLQEELMRREVG